jgi:hypothetical protein
MTYIVELKNVIRELHGVESTYLQSVPVKEVFNGQTVWEGVVEVFQLRDHPKANIAYAWTHDTDDPAIPKRTVTVLQVPPAVSPETAVRVAILEELKSPEPSKEAS